VCVIHAVGMTSIYLCISYFVTITVCKIDFILVFKVMHNMLFTIDTIVGIVGHILFVGCGQCYH
jgi:hypothetical protein